MIDLLDSYLDRLLSGCGADAAVIWTRIGEAGTGSVVCARPAGLVAAPAPWPVTDAAISAVIQRDPATVAALVPTSVRLDLPRAPVAALSTALTDPDLTLLLIWYDTPAGDELSDDLQGLIAKEITYSARGLARQNQLSRGAQRLEAVIGDLKQGVVSVDHSLEQVSVNAAAAKLLGLGEGEVAAADFAAAMTAFEERALNRAEFDAMGQLLLADGWADLDCTLRFATAPTHVRVSSHAIRQGAYSGRVWVFDDVSRAAQALEASESAQTLMRASADSMLDPQVLLEAVRDPGGRVVDFRYLRVNPATCAYLGVQEDDLVGHTQLEAAPNLEGSELQRRYVQCLEDGQPVILQDFAFFNEILDDDRRYDIQATRAGTDLVSLSWRDVTERYRAAQRVADSELKYRLIAENSSDAIVHAREGRVVWISPSIEALMGAPPEYWVGRALRETVPAQGREAHERRMKSLAEGHAVQERVQLIGANGVRHWFHMHSKPFYDARGHPDGFTSALRLIDDEVAAEQQAEEARRQQARADQRFRRSMDNAAVGMCIVAPDGSLVEVNEAMCALFGYDADTLKAKTWQELTAPEYLEADLKNVADVLAGRIDSYRMLKQYLHADGHRIWGDLSVSCVRGEDGQVESFVSQIADTTATVEANQKYRLLAENAGDMVTHVRDGRFIWVSPSVQSVLGAPAEYWIGRHVLEIIPPEDLSDFEDRLAALNEGGVVQQRVQVKGVDGGTHWAHLHAKPFYDAAGHQDGFTAALRLIDEEVAAQQEADEARRQQAAADARYRRSMDTSAVGMCLLAPDGTFLEVNPALCELFGYDAKTLMTKTWKDVTAPGYLDVGDAERQEVFDGSRDAYRIVKQYVHADGHPIWADVAVSCVRDENGQVETLATQIADITAEVQAREELVQSDEQNRTLAQLLQQQSDRLADELHSAADYMASIMPRGLTAGAVRVESRYLPSRELGGDCFDYSWIDDDHFLVYLIDVSGHGIEPALLSVSVHNMLRSGSLGTQTLLSPEAALAALNRLFQMEEQDGHFFTIWYGVYQASTRTLRYATAGAPPALAIHVADDGDVTLTELSTPAEPVGMFDDTEFISNTYSVPAGDRILIFSDGAHELALSENKLLSFAEFTELNTRLAASSSWSLDGLVKELKALTPTGVFVDDCSLIQLSFN